MNLDALLAPLPESNKTLPCKVGRIVLSLEDPYKTALTNLLANDHSEGGLTAESLEARMREAGLEVSASVIRKHRRHACSCEKSA